MESSSQPRHWAKRDIGALTARDSDTCAPLFSISRRSVTATSCVRSSTTCPTPCAKSRPSRTSCQERQCVRATVRVRARRACSRLAGKQGAAEESARRGAEPGE
eukprot:1485568-Rhodomonas_salina.2